MHKVLYAVGSVAIMVALAGCGATSTTPEAAAPSEAVAAAPADTQASLACDHFRNIVGDIDQGILTPQEVRAKMIEVHDNSSIAPRDVQDAATKLLAAATQDDGPGFLVAVGAMSKACAAAGS